MSATTLPSHDEIWSVEGHVLAAQRVAFEFFAAHNWIWAAKTLIRAERLARRLPPERNPFEQAGRQFLDQAEQRPAPPPAAAAPPPRPAETIEAKHALFVAAFKRANALRTRAGVPVLSWEDALDHLAQTHGQDERDGIAAVEARLTAGPSG